MRKFLSVFISLCICVLAVAAPKQSALDKAVAYIKASPSLKIVYTAGTSKGSLTMENCKFAMQMGSVSAWFDGKTQWVYNRDTNETSITEPTKSEIAESSPFALLTSYKTLFKIASETTAKGTTTVTLVPIKKGLAVKKVVLTMNAANNRPTKMVVTGEDGNPVAFTITEYQRGKKLPDTYFKYNAKGNPGAHINDLR